MPPTRFRSDLHKVKEAGLEQVCQLANLYDTSKLATARRFVDLLGDPMAVVQTKDGVVSQIYRRNDFPYISLAKGQAVQRKSITRG